MAKEKIYLDYAATTPMDEAVFGAMKPFFCETFGNASSAHQFGREAREAVEKARAQAAEFLGCAPEEIIFTSCATESNNLALKGVVKKIRQMRGAGFVPHIITSAIEHHCVIHSCEALEKDGLAEVTYLPVDKEGLVEVESVEKAIKENTILVSIMYANNEIGTVQPIKEIGEVIKRKNNENFSTSSKNKLYFHVDAVQAINYLDCNVDRLGADLLSLSAHKFYGPKGVGALYIRKGTPIKRIQDGGEQEFKLRAGTLNTPGIVGLGEAIKSIKYNVVSIKEIERLRDKLIDNILRNVPNAKLNGSREKRLLNNANFSFPGAEGEAILLALDLEGIAVSTGSACASENLNPSHVLIALGLGPEETHSSIRMTLGKYTKEEDIDRVLEILPKAVERLRNISGQKGEAKKKLPDDFGC
jgi:cysteine desulfurase